jgi:hypothetical protein
MQRIRIEIKLAPEFNNAHCLDDSEEVSRIIQQILTKGKREGKYYSRPVYDLNGDKCGSIDILE